MKTFKEKKSAEQIYEGIKLAHKINGHCSICYPCLESIKAEATKAERERCMNILMEFQQEFRVAALATVLEIKKRLK